MLVMAHHARDKFRVSKRPKSGKRVESMFVECGVKLKVKTNRQDFTCLALGGKIVKKASEKTRK